MITTSNTVNCGIYRITHLSSGRAYIGSSCNIQKRIKVHRNSLIRDGHHSKFLQRAFNKYGEEFFSVDVLVGCSKKDLLLYEQLCLDLYKPEFNGTMCAHSPVQPGQKLPAEWVEKVKNTVVSRYASGFKIIHPPRSEEYRISVSKSSKERWENPEHRLKNTIGIQQSMTKEECSKRSDRTKKLWQDPVYRANAIASRKGKASNKGYKCTPEQIENRRRNARISHMKRRYGEDWRLEYALYYPAHIGDLDAV